MKITLYNTPSPRNQVNKVLNNAQDVNINLKPSTDILHPTLILGGVSITGFNYCYIPDFNRYYYINDMESGGNNVNSRTLTVDVLMSYNNEIRQIKALVERQENFYNLYLPELQIPNYAYKRVQTKTFPMQPLNVGTQVILATTGMSKGV